MYKTIKGKKIEVDSNSIECVCGGCPTTFEFKDIEGDSYHFRLRHGGARIVHETSDTTLLSDYMEDFDGVCSWEDVVKWAATHGIYILESVGNYDYE